MKKLATTQLSSRGQLVIPDFIRKTLNLEAGDQFIVFAKDDVIILKKIEIHASTVEKFETIIDSARDQLRSAGLQPLNLDTPTAQKPKKR